jgi:hypothetical protein
MAASNGNVNSDIYQGQVHSIRRNSFESYQSEATPYRKTLQADDLSCAIRSCLVSMVPPLHRDLRLLRLLLSTSPRVIRLRHLLMRKNVQLNSHRTVTKIFADTTASASHSCTQKRRSCLKKELPRFWVLPLNHHLPSPPSSSASPSISSKKDSKRRDGSGLQTKDVSCVPQQQLQRKVSIVAVYFVVKRRCASFWPCWRSRVPSGPVREDRRS